MLIKEKTIIKMTMEYEEEEYDVLLNTYNIIDSLLSEFNENQIKGICSIATGEYINKFDLYKAQGIINGLLTNTEWLLEEV